MSDDRPPGFCVIYRWRIRSGHEDAFRVAWLSVTERYLRDAGSFGSRLHQADDGIWVAYAQWPSRDAWHASHEIDLDPDDVERMGSAVLERFEPIPLEVDLDRLRAIRWTLNRVAVTAADSDSSDVDDADHPPTSANRNETSVCPRCGYILRGADQCLCSECGFRYESLAVKHARERSLASNAFIMMITVRCFVVLSLMISATMAIALIMGYIRYSEAASAAGSVGVTTIGRFPLQIEPALRIGVVAVVLLLLVLLAPRVVLRLVGPLTRDRISMHHRRWFVASALAAGAALALAAPLIVLVMFA